VSSTSSNHTARAGRSEPAPHDDLGPPKPVSGAAGIEWISAADITAVVIRSTAEPKATSFVTPATFPLQLGFVVYPEGGAVAAHRHRPEPRTVIETAECLLVRRGRCRVTFHSESDVCPRSVQLAAGDVLLIVQGAHSVDFDEDTVLLEVKQGPYLGPGEKELI
jgi:hypothetical protein